MENEFGWLNCYIYGDNAYLENLHIYKEHRKKQHGTMMLSNLELVLKELHSVKVLHTSISRTGLEDPDRNLQITLKRGFKFSSSTNDVIILKKEL